MKYILHYATKVHETVHADTVCLEEGFAVFSEGANVLVKAVTTKDLVSITKEKDARDK